MRDLGTDPEYAAQVEKLSYLTGIKYYYFAKACEFSGGPYGNAILSKVPIIKAETIIIPDPDPKAYDGYYETRCVLKAELEGGITVLITHMGLDPDEKENAVRTVMENLTPKKCILMGDFNMEPDHPFLRPIFDQMTDTAEKFDAEKTSFPSDAPNCKIDYIFVSNDIEVLAADIPPIVASDHRPHTALICC
jgi:endonuclease/exonuclease/phosphatase family metal-dependent hydrolase